MAEWVVGSVLNGDKVKYRISRKFDTELNLAVGDFLWKSPNLIRHMQIQWCFIIQCDRQTAKYNFVKVIRYWFRQIFF